MLHGRKGKGIRRALESTKVRCDEDEYWWDLNPPVVNMRFTSMVQVLPGGLDEIPSPAGACDPCY